MKIKSRPPKKPFGINQLRIVFRRVFDSDEGRIALNYILKRGFVFTHLDESRTGNQFEIYRNEGARNLALMILNMSKTPIAEITDDYYETRLEQNPNA